MSKQHTRKITIRVTHQTAYHLKQMAQVAGAAPGKIVDALTTAAQKGKQYEKNSR